MKIIRETVTLGVIEVPLSLACQAPGLSFVIRYRSEPEVLKDQLLLVRVGTGLPGDGR
jgi:hypothetical protein